MIDINLYFTFVLAALFIIATLRSSVSFVISRSVNLGITSRLFFEVEVSIGALCHAVLVSVGLAKQLFMTHTPPTNLLILNI